jgi:hypothetical protein
LTVSASGSKAIGVYIASGVGRAERRVTLKKSVAARPSSLTAGKRSSSPTDWQLGLFRLNHSITDDAEVTAPRIW